MDIEKLDETGLQKLKEQIKNREKAIELEKRNKIIEIERVKLDKLIELNIIDLLEHSRTSCSDEHPSNGYYESEGYARCNKCHLIEIIEDHKNGINDFQVSFDINISKID